MTTARTLGATMVILAAAATSAAANPYPLARIDRPRTLPAGAMQLGVGFTAGDQLEPIGSRFDLAYAPIDRLELRVSYAPQLSDAMDLKRPVVVSIRHFTIKRAPHFWLATQLDLPINTTGDTMTSVVAGLPAKVKLAPRVAVFFGDRLAKIDWSSSTRVTFTVPIDAGVQVADHLMLQLGTTLVTAPVGGMEPVPATTTIADVTPVIASAFVSPEPTLDIGFQFGFTDVQRAASTTMLGVSAAWRGGL